jgi:hypothetical protein
MCFTRGYSVAFDAQLLSFISNFGDCHLWVVPEPKVFKVWFSNLRRSKRIGTIPYMRQQCEEMSLLKSEVADGKMGKK